MSNTNRWIKPAAIAVAAAAMIGGGIAAWQVSRPDAPTTPEALRSVAAACEDSRGAWISARDAGSCLWRLSSDSETSAASAARACTSAGWVDETLRYEGEGALTLWCSVEPFAAVDTGAAG